MKKRKSILGIIIVAFLSLFITVYGDMGPKDYLKITVTNPPKEVYYLDLLTTNPGKYTNLDEEERKGLNEGMIEQLYTYASEGWYPALAKGTNTPMWGTLIGEEKQGQYYDFLVNFL